MVVLLPLHGQVQSLMVKFLQIIPTEVEGQFSL
jgi:hypothetical protein